MIGPITAVATALALVTSPVQARQTGSLDLRQPRGGRNGADSNGLGSSNGVTNDTNQLTCDASMGALVNTSFPALYLGMSSETAVIPENVKARLDFDSHLRKMVNEFERKGTISDHLFDKARDAKAKCGNLTQFDKGTVNIFKQFSDLADQKLARMDKRGLKEHPLRAALADTKSQFLSLAKLEPTSDTVAGNQEDVAKSQEDVIDKASVKQALVSTLEQMLEHAMETGKTHASDQTAVNEAKSKLVRLEGHFKAQVKGLERRIKEEIRKHAPTDIG